MWRCKLEGAAGAAKLAFLILTALVLLSLWWTHNGADQTVRVVLLAGVVPGLARAVFIYYATNCFTLHAPKSRRTAKGLLDATFDHEETLISKKMKPKYDKWIMSKILWVALLTPYNEGDQLMVISAFVY